VFAGRAEDEADSTLRSERVPNERGLGPVPGRQYAQRVPASAKKQQRKQRGVTRHQIRKKGRRKKIMRNLASMREDERIQEDPHDLQGQRMHRNIKGVETIKKPR